MTRRRRGAPRAARPGPRDAGLQGERTALAWNRTGLAIFVNALLALRAGWSSNTPALMVAGVALLGAAGACGVCGAWRRRHLFSGAASIAAPAPIIGAATAVTLLACATALLSFVTMA